jgi:hypothetical protein
MIAQQRGSTPTIREIQESELYLSPPPNGMQIVIDQLTNMVGPFFFLNFVEWWTVAQKEYELGLIGERGVDETIEAMTTACDAVLATIER